MLLSTFITTPNIPVYIETFSNKKLKLSGEELKGVRFGFRIEPFTAAMAAELSAELKAALFNRTDGEPKALFASCRPDMEFKSQRIEIRPDPTMEASIVLADAKIVARPLVRRTAEGTHLILRWSIEVPEISGQELLYMKEAMNEQRYFTIERSEPGLFDQDEMETRRNAKDAAPVRRGRHVEHDEPTLEEIH